MPLPSPAVTDVGNDPPGWEQRPLSPSRQELERGWRQVDVPGAGDKFEGERRGKGFSAEELGRAEGHRWSQRDAGRAVHPKPGSQSQERLVRAWAGLTGDGGSRKRHRLAEALCLAPRPNLGWVLRWYLPPDSSGFTGNS